MMGFGLARVGRDVEVRNTADGDPVANVSLAFSYGRKGADGKRPTTWVDATLWGKRAEVMAPYLVRGQAVVVNLSEVRLDEFKTQDGTRTKIAARIEQIELAGPKPGATAAPPPAPRPPPPPPKPAPSADLGDLDDDVPF